MERDFEIVKQNKDIRRYNTCSASRNNCCTFNFGRDYNNVYNGRE